MDYKTLYYSPEPAGMKMPVLRNNDLDSALDKLRSAFLVLVPWLQITAGARQRLVDLRHPIPKYERCDGQIVNLS